MAKPPLQQQRVLAFIAASKSSADGNPPTRKDIAEHFGFSEQAADHHVLRLVAKGLVVLDSHGRVMLVGGSYFPPET